MNLKQVTKELTKKRDKEDLSDSNLEFEAYIDGIKDCFNLINKPVETTNEKPIEIEELENFPVMCLCGEHTEECCADYCTE